MDGGLFSPFRGFCGPPRWKVCVWGGGRWWALWAGGRGARALEGAGRDNRRDGGELPRRRRAGELIRAHIWDVISVRGADCPPLPGSGALWDERRGPGLQSLLQSSITRSDNALSPPSLRIVCQFKTYKKKKEGNHKLSERCVEDARGNLWIAAVPSLGYYLFIAVCLRTVVCCRMLHAAQWVDTCCVVSGAPPPPPPP